MLEILQRSDEWFAKRLGKITASRIDELLRPAANNALILDLAVERLTGQRKAVFVNAAMQRGVDIEPIARAAYEAEKGVVVAAVGFVGHPVLLMAGASPDGLVGEDGALEIKCPNTASHLETILSGEVPGRYVSQIQWQLACTGRAWCDFVSFDDRLADRPLFVVRVERDEVAIKALEERVRLAEAEIQGIFDRITGF